MKTSNIKQTHNRCFFICLEITYMWIDVQQILNDTMPTLATTLKLADMQIFFQLMKSNFFKNLSLYRCNKCTPMSIRLSICPRFWYFLFIFNCIEHAIIQDLNDFPKPFSLYYQDLCTDSSSLDLCIDFFKWQ